MHKKSQKTPIFIGSKKGGQVIDPTVAKLLTLKWPKCGQVKSAELRRIQRGNHTQRLSHNGARWSGRAHNHQVEFQQKLKFATIVRDRKGTPKNFCDKDFAELSGELAGAICLKTPVLVGSALELFRKFLGAVRAIFWLWGSLLALETEDLDVYPKHLLRQKMD